MDLIYTNSDRVDQGVLLDYELDLAFGADENNLECRVQAQSHCCESGSLLYIEGTEYGGIIDSIESDTDSKEVIYSGRTWHGIIDSKVLQPDSGEAYLTLSGEANSVIASLLTRMDLTDLFAASAEDSGLTIKNYKMNRYITGYGGIIKMLGSVGGKLKMAFDNDKVILSAVAVHDYTQDEEFDADLVPFRAKRNYLGVNHLICLGSGQLENRMVIHLYADEEGNISQEQTQFGLDEVCTIFEYPNIETEEELLQEGMDKFESLKGSDEISIDFDADSDVYDVGDIIGAVDNITGLTANAAIAKKIVTIKNGRITISLSPDTAKKGSSYEVNGGGESSNTPTFAFYPQIIVSSLPGSTVTCSKGDIVLTAEEVNGTWTFNVTDYGEWTVTVSLSEASNSTTVQVTAVCQMPIEIYTEFATIFVTGLEESNTVSATKEGKTVNGVWTTVENPAIVVPDGYTELEYIESTGTQYIDTGLMAKPGYRAVIDFYTTASTVSDQTILGGSGNTNVGCIYLGANYGSAYMSFYRGYNSTWFDNPLNVLALNTRYLIESDVGLTSQSLTINGVSQFTGNLSMSAVTSTTPLYLFCRGGLSNYAYIRLYSLKIYDTTNADTLIRDFIPCINPDGETGLYDIVTGAFYTNAGSGTFTAGAEIPATVDCFAIKPITDYGTWTVTATDGTNTATQDVLVDSAAEFAVEMGYEPNYIMLYNFGDECDEVTGGWNSGIGRGSVTYTENESNLYMYASGSGRSVNAITANKVAISECSELRMYAKHYYSTTSSMWGEFAAVNSTASSNGWDYTDQAVSGALADLAANNTLAFFTLDASGLSGEYYPVVRVATTGSVTEYIEIYSMFLTKPDDYKTLCSKAGLSAPADIATLIADTTSITTILANEAAVKHMVNYCTGDFMASFVASSACLSALDSSPYKSLVFANKHWAKFLAMVGVTK